MKSAVKPGQVLILVLLVVVVSLAVGLSVASRNITNIRTSTQTEESQKAFSAAEGGIESVLSQGLSSLVPGTTQVDVGNIKANVNVEKKETFEAQIVRGSVGQISIVGMETKPVKISWAKNGETAASIEVTQLWGCCGSAPGVQTRNAYDGGSSESLGKQFGFNDALDPGGCEGYAKCVTITIANDNATLLRIRPFWHSNSFLVKAIPPNVLPTQTYTLKSTASTADGITRTVQVTKTLPQLPAVFDYAIYSDSAIVK